MTITLADPPPLQTIKYILSWSIAGALDFWQCQLIQVSINKRHGLEIPVRRGINRKYGM